MSHELFHPDDIFINRVKTHPEFNFFIYNTNVTINNHSNLAGKNNYASSVPEGYISLFGMNIDRSNAHLGDSATAIHPFLDQGGSSYKQVFKYKVNSMLGKRTILSQSSCNTASYFTSGDVLLQERPEMRTEPRLGPFKATITRRLTIPVAVVYGPNTFTDCSPISYYVKDDDQNFTINFTASALQNTARKYSTLSKHFIFQPTGANSPLYTYGGKEGRGSLDFFTGALGQYGSGGGTFLTRSVIHSDVNFMFIPSIFYGSTMKRGSVNLKYYITGSLVGECADIRQNGELVSTSGSTSGSVVGICMYDEGIILLTSSVPLDGTSATGTAQSPDNGISYRGTGVSNDASWLYFGTTCNDGVSHSTLHSASYNLSFKGTSYTSTMTLFCHSKKGQHNISNNPTFYDNVNYTASLVNAQTSSYTWAEGQIGIKNIVSSSYKDASEKFKKTTYLSKVGIYDDHGNLIAVASTSRPIKKTEEDEYTFKLTLDI